jgi:molybdopterin synthase sulfur carrier subunit
MRVTLLYFASLREAVGIERETIELPADVDTTAGVRAWLRSRGDAWARVLAEGRNVRAAVDQRMAFPDTKIADGAEVAFFPPVTGG